MEKRRQLFYDTLVSFSEHAPNEWVGKEQLARIINGEYSYKIGYVMKLYELNYSDTAHDICSLMNADRLAINESLAYEKIILIKDNKFKIATLEETLAEEKKIRANALKALWRGSLIKAKRLQNGQVVIDFAEEVEKVIETFGGKYDI